ncbi:hypothetical protein BGZ65_000828, partial [Modicella reniformis]
ARLPKKSADEVLEKLGLDHLRQLRSKFDHLSTFGLWRCSGPLTDKNVFRPYTVYTILDFGGGVYAVGEIFNKIGKAVILHGKEAVLCHDDVQHAVEICGSSRDFLPALKAIICLFKEEKEIPIRRNSKLNEELEKMAGLLSSRISVGNRSIASEIKNLFGLTTSSA